MVALYDGVSLTVEFSPTTDPLDTPSWVDITAYVRSVPYVFRGRTDEYSDLSPGTCTVVLDNPDRRFDPDHTAGPYYGNLVPMRRLKVTWAYGVSSGLLFSGFILGWPQQESGHVDLVSTISAVDGSRAVRNAPLAASAYGAEVAADSPTHYWPVQGLGDRIVDQVGTLNLAPNGGTLEWVEQAMPLGEPWSVNLNWDTAEDQAVSPYLTGGARLVDAPPKALDLWVDFEAGGFAVVPNLGFTVFAVNAYATLDNIGIVGYQGQYRLDYHNTADNRYFDWTAATGGFTIPPGVHHVAVTADTTNVYAYVDGQLARTETLSVGTQAGSAQPGMRITTQARQNVTGEPTYPTHHVSHVALYPAALSAARIQAHHLAGRYAWGHPYKERTDVRLGRVLDEIGWPAGLRNIGAGATIQGRYLPAGQDVMEYVRALERTEQGIVFFDVDGNLTLRGRPWLLTQADSGVVFTDDGAAGGVRYRDLVRDGNHVDTVRNIVTVSYSDVGAITRRDEASISSHLEQREFIDGPTLPSGRAASQLAAYVLRLKKDPGTRISMLEVPLRIGSGANEVADILGRELGDVVTVERTPIGVGDQVQQSVQILGVEHQVSTTQWLVRFYLAPAVLSAPDAPYLTLGSSTDGHLGLAVAHLDADNDLVSTPDDAAIYAALDGDHTLTLRVALGDWTPSANVRLAESWMPSTDQRSFALVVETGGTLRWTYSTNGTTSTDVVSTAAPSGVTAGQPIWLAVTFRQTNGSVSEVRFWQAADSVSPPASGDWTQIGATRTLGSVVTLHDSTSEFGFGRNNTGAVTRRLHYGALFDGIGGSFEPAGTEVLRFDPDLVRRHNASDPFGRVWTVTGGSLRGSNLLPF